MEYKQFRKRLSERLERDPQDVDALIEGLSIIIRENCSDLTPVTIPSFGTFIPEKHDEEISTDLSTGKRMLLPPEISLSFQPSAILLKQTSSSQPTDE